MRVTKPMRDAASIPVPENLASRILLRQSFVPRPRDRRWWRWPVTVAASVILAIGLLLGNWIGPKPEPGLDRDVE